MKICVVGLGYVGLPLATYLDKHFDIVGFDVNSKKIENLKKGINELEEECSIEGTKIDFTSDPETIKECGFIIICVPTPVLENKKPDVSYLEKASALVGGNLSKDSIVVYESTVYPGVTEEICAPILEKQSGLKCGTDFKIGYSPERINPGDKEHTVDKIVKVVAGMDKKSLEKINQVYSKITKTHKASSIKVAEAAKVIENVQRDLNIALINELTILFDKLDVNVYDVLEAANTKWNFHKYTPGLVGGHCIGVDPYYLTYKAQEVGYDPKIILSGRNINDNMHKFYVDKIMEKIKKGTVHVLGLTFKKNVADPRNSRVKNLIEELKSRGFEVYAYDPLLTDETVEKEFNIKNTKPEEVNADLYVLAVPHDAFSNLNLKTFDLRKIWDEK